MRVVSGPIGRERVHYEAPEAKRLNKEMSSFLKWFNHNAAHASFSSGKPDPVIKAAVAHLWFVTIHPFDDGNGRIARAITEMQLTRSDRSRERFYSMSVQICKERKAYYDILQLIQKNATVSESGINITSWLEWFLSCLNRAINTTETTLSEVIRKADFWQSHPLGTMNERQAMMINKLLDDFKGKLTSSKWAKITKCSQDTAIRDINDLIQKDVLIKEPGGGRSTSYLVKEPVS